MDSKEFSYYRKKLQKTQKEMAQLLGTSIKAVHSYEQGWRSVPPHVERQVFYLVSNVRGNGTARKNCWSINKCPRELKKNCPAWEFNSGKLCWFINGTVCGGIIHKDWSEKMTVCRECKVFISLFQSEEEEAGQ